jgi:hypothetical protein
VSPTIDIVTGVGARVVVVAAGVDVGETGLRDLDVATDVCFDPPERVAAPTP